MDGTAYEQDTLHIIPGQAEPFHHTDHNRLRKIADPRPIRRRWRHGRRPGKAHDR
jgi:hypothetical protein